MDFYRSIQNTIRVIWGWKTSTWHWNGFITIFTLSAVTSNVSLSWDKAPVCFHWISFSFWFIFTHRTLTWLTGAVSTHYHLLFHQSRRFIRGIICLSGSAFLRYSYLDEKSHLKKMYDFAQKINGSVEHIHELIEFLEHVPAETIVNYTSQASFDRTLIFDWAPVIESNGLDFLSIGFFLSQWFFYISFRFRFRFLLQKNRHIGQFY